MFFVAMNAGAVKLSVAETLKVVCGWGDEKNIMLVKGICLPRVVVGIVAGVGLDIAGCIMQNNLRNPLAYLPALGIANAGAFRANFAIILTPNF